MSAKYVMKMDDVMLRWFLATLEDAVPHLPAAQRERIKAVIGRMSEMKPGQMTIFQMTGEENGVDTNKAIGRRDDLHG